MLTITSSINTSWQIKLNLPGNTSEWSTHRVAQGLRSGHTSDPDRSFLSSLCLLKSSATSLKATSQNQTKDSFYKEAAKTTWLQLHPP